MSSCLLSCVDYLLLTAFGGRQSLHCFGCLGSGISLTPSVMFLMEAMGTSPPAQTETMVCVTGLWFYDCGDLLSEPRQVMLSYSVEGINQVHTQDVCFWRGQETSVVSQRDPIISSLPSEIGKIYDVFVYLPVFAKQFFKNHIITLGFLNI